MEKKVFAKFGFGFAIALILVLFCSAGVSLAGGGVDYGDVQSTSPESGKRVTVGAGVAVVPDYEGSDDYEAFPLLHFRMAWANGRYLDFTGNRLKYNFMADSNWSIGPMARYRGKRDDDVEEDAVAEMKEVDAAIELGGFVAYNFGENFEIGADLVQDVADGHDGYLVGFHIGYKIHMEKMMIGLKGFTTFVNNDYMEAYFSVNGNNVGNSSLDYYDADDGFKDVGITCVLSYQINNSWGATGVLGYTRLIGDAEDSPVVDDVGDANQLLGGIMATYRF